MSRSTVACSWSFASLAEVVRKGTGCLLAITGAVTADAAGVQATCKLQGGDWSVFEHTEVEHAPKPSMGADKLKSGTALSFTDARGTIHKFKLDDNVMVNMYKTKADTWRSGDLHNCTQYDISLGGDISITYKDLTTGRGGKRRFSANQLIVVPPRQPTLFYFHDTNYLLEWWECPFEAWYYKPYRDIIES